MRTYLIAALFLGLSFSVGAEAMNAKVEDGVRHNLSGYCATYMPQIHKQIEKYEKIPPEKRSKTDKIKLNFWKNELLNWQKYCSR